ncbi:MAG: protoheme IX farnesyltransferase, partial [Proteobacteria bacterium]|nr:protoheme IX farnesyltransferase [Pseudomonadota bacterium]
MTEPTTESDTANDSRLRAYYELTKPGIAGYVMITAGVSAFVGSRGTIDMLFAIHTMLGTGIATGGALTLNQYMERDIDAVMHRTRTRPLPSGRLNPIEALVFGALLLVGGLFYLGTLVGIVPAALAGLSAAIY